MLKNFKIPFRSIFLKFGPQSLGGLLNRLQFNRGDTKENGLTSVTKVADAQLGMLVF